MIEKAEPVSERDRALLGSPSVITLRPDTEGTSMKVRITRACNDWIEGDEPEIHADYAKELIANGLAEEVKAKPAPTGKAKPGK